MEMDMLIWLIDWLGYLYLAMRYLTGGTNLVHRHMGKSLPSHRKYRLRVADLQMRSRDLSWSIGSKVSK